jgi:transposase
MLGRPLYCAVDDSIGVRCRVDLSVKRSKAHQRNYRPEGRPTPRLAGQRQRPADSAASDGSHISVMTDDIRRTRACLPNGGRRSGDAWSVSRTVLLTDAQWGLIAALLPSSVGRRGRRFRDDRRVVEGIIYRYRCGLPWRDVPAEFGPWQTLWKRHRRYSSDGTWDHVLAALLTSADAAGVVNWDASVDSTVIRAHQHAANLARDTGGAIELHESAGRTG